MNNLNTYVIQNITQLLNASGDLPPDANLFEYGLNSIKLIQLIGILKKRNISVSFKELVTVPTLNAWLSLCNAQRENEEKTQACENSSKEKRFAMTPMQKAYYWGRQTDQPLGGISCHAYVEFSPETTLDSERLAKAWKKLFVKHPALRTKFYPDGTQEILETSPGSEEIIFYDLTSLDDTSKKEKLLDIRSHHSHKLLDVENGQVIELAVSKLDPSHVRLHLGLDLLVADVVSFKIIIDDLADLYLHDSPVTEIPWSFSQYLRQKEQKRSANYEADKLFWEELVKDIQPGCNLPFATRPESLTGATYQRHGFSLSRTDYENLKALASENRTTVSMILLSLYCLILGRWSGQKKLLINIPLFNRDLSIENTDLAVADFTDLTLINVNLSEGQSLLELSEEIRNSFYNCYSHSAFGGLEVQKLLAQSSGSELTAPVVFSCTEGVRQFSEKCVSLLGKPDYIITQTPQVYIDFQIFQIGDELRCIWDVPEKLFRQDMITEMIGALEKGVRLFLSRGGDLSSENLNEIFKASLEYPDLDSSVSIPDSIVVPADEYLYSGFFRNVQSSPDHIALVDAETDTSYTYKDLGLAVSYMAEQLLSSGVRAGTKVALTVGRGVKEIIGILSILSVGGCYVPITPAQPEVRRRNAMENMGIRYAVTDEKNKDKIPAGVSLINFCHGKAASLFNPVKADPSHGAYIILTSGTTGNPKGVEISHASALNTILDVNRRVAFSENDRILAVSSIDFDLSVYDIFGTFQAGGTLVVLGQKHYRDAEFWKEAALKYHVTLWNSVPLLFDMLLTVSEKNGTAPPLRAVMLSGDWILSSLYQRLTKTLPDCRFIGMGGATEASIWSNWYEVRSEADLRGKYVPYGRSLSNQAYRIVDDSMQDCPHYATGELLIGGKGLALGYYNDPEKTGAKFITLNGTRWYRTGDKGYFDNDGVIEFLGRIDQQCKVRGHRIEVGEIEKHLGTYFHSENVVCWPCGPENAYNHLEACIFDRPEGLKEEEIEAALQFLKQRLPSYMIPTAIHTGDKLPMSANGKADRKKIRLMFQHSGQTEKSSPSQDTDDGSLFNQIKDLWCANLSLSDASGEDNYYFSGGDSLKAIRLSASINDVLHIHISTSEVLEAQTLADLVKKINWSLNDEKQQ